MSTQKRPYLLASSRWKEIKATEFQLAILPWGATEAHNYHLPYSTDVVQCSYIAEQAAELIWREGYRPIVLPCVPFGVQCSQLGVKFNLNMRPSTQFCVLKDLVESLEHQGLRKLVLLNGHGGNHFVQMLRELYLDSRMRIFTVSWYDCVDARKFFEEPGEHGGEMETSLMMHIAPELVLPLSEAGVGGARNLKVASLRQGWAWAQRGWLGEVTQDTGIGNPAKADPKKGEAFLREVISKISVLLKEVADLDPSNQYE